MIPPPSKARKWWNMFDLYTLFFLQTRQRKWRVRRFGGHMQILDGCGPINYSHVTSEYANIRPSQLAKCLANKTSLGDRLRWSPRLSSMSPATIFFLVGGIFDRIRRASFTRLPCNLLAFRLSTLIISNLFTFFLSFRLIFDPIHSVIVLIFHPH